MPIDVTQQSMLSTRDAIASRAITAAGVLRKYLDRIEAIDGGIGAYNEVLIERATGRAERVDSGELGGPLAGVPIAIKDNICTAFGKTTCSSKILADYRSPFNATVIDRLERAGAIIIGKTNLDEFAMGSSCENSGFAPTRNPWDTDRVPGGSSGGSAAAVAADLCSAALGSDTGGSIRQPAAFCGVVGLKPTYGRVSRYGLVAYGSSLDQIGPITRTVADAAVLLNAIAGHDPLDSTSADEITGGPVPDFNMGLGTPVENLHLGIAKQYMSDANDDAVNGAVNAAIERYRAMGATIVDVDLPHTEYGIPCYYIVATAEASSNLARFDGVHYGHRTAKPDDLIDVYSASRAEGFGDEVKRRVMLGTYALSSGYYDAYYLKAQKVRRLIKRDFDRAFEQCDAIICPPTPAPAFRMGENSADPLQMYMADVYTVNANLAGIPGVSIPAGFAEAADRRLPVGLQLLGPTFSEHKLLRIAAMYERETGFASQRPDLAAVKTG